MVAMLDFQVARWTVDGHIPEQAGRSQQGQLVAAGLVFDAEHLPLLFSRFGKDHVMVGSDFPFMRGTPGAEERVVHDAVKLAACTEVEAEGILARNAARFLGISPGVSLRQPQPTSAVPRFRGTERGP
jgi:hypothetical protein